MLKKLYHVVALFAVLNLLVLGGAVAYLAGTGRLSGERVEQIAGVLRGEWPRPQETQAEESTEAPPPAPSSDTLVQEQAEEEVLRLRVDRRRAELQQQAATIAAARLEVTRQREALERREGELDALQSKREKEEESAGFQKELELFASMKPKLAVTYLLEKPPEDAAALLLQMDTRKSKRLVEAAKTASQRRAMTEVLEKLREVSPAQADLLSATQE